MLIQDAGTLLTHLSWTVNLQTKMKGRYLSIAVLLLADVDTSLIYQWEKYCEDYSIFSCKRSTGIMGGGGGEGAHLLTSLTVDLCAEISPQCRLSLPPTSLLLTVSHQSFSQLGTAYMIPLCKDEMRGDMILMY